MARNGDDNQEGSYFVLEVRDSSDCPFEADHSGRVERWEERQCDQQRGAGLQRDAQDCSRCVAGTWSPHIFAWHE